MPDIANLTFDQASELALRWGANGFWALAIVVVGLMIAGWGERAVRGGLGRVKRCDAMLCGFFASLARWAIMVFVGIAALERLGVQTTSMVAILGAAGLAVGLALQGTLSNLAAGVMLLLFRPFRVGDSVEAGAIAGSIREVTLFHTTLATGDNVQVLAPNAVLWSAALRNLSAYPTRKVEVTIPVPLSEDLDAAIETLRGMVTSHDRVLQEPAPAVTVAKLGEKVADVVVSGWCASGDAGKVKADLTAEGWRRCLRGKVAG